MVSKKKKKYSSGEGAQFMTRKAALKKLQLSLKDFRRICILKGIYPREPRNRKRAQKGAGGIKTLYHTKDIKFLLHEPIIWKLRELKVYQQKIRRARAMREYRNMKKFLRDYPDINIDHIVKERYPTFVDALRDLDDCLTLCFLFSTFPSLKKVPRDQSMLCRRLTVEFMHAVIAAKALRKVFVSVKGYYYQVELEGQIITWIVPHHFSFQVIMVYYFIQILTYACSIACMLHATRIKTKFYELIQVISYLCHKLLGLMDEHHKKDRSKDFNNTFINPFIDVLEGVFTNFL